ncbi:hypothetical protein AC249_AIPGENE7598 [Exaiptasia diaphana]|nr:hypothetical protein AC249_AIPGENE7598 [Exaiptasia diaphana]
MNRIKFLRFLKLLLGISLLFSCVLPLEAIGCDPRLADKLMDRKLSGKIHGDNSSTSTVTLENDEDLENDDDDSSFVENDENDEWENYDFECDSGLDSCVLPLEAIGCDPRLADKLMDRKLSGKIHGDNSSTSTVTLENDEDLENDDDDSSFVENDENDEWENYDFECDSGLDRYRKNISTNWKKQ